MFAVEKAFDYDEENTGNAVVWVLNSQKLNEKAIRRTDIVDIVNGRDVLESADGPVVVSSPKNNSRINAQNGVFAFFPYDSKPLISPLRTAGNLSGYLAVTRAIRQRT